LGNFFNLFLGHLNALGKKGLVVLISLKQKGIKLLSSRGGELSFPPRKKKGLNWFGE
jgi:hypothetical protein